MREPFNRLIAALFMGAILAMVTFGSLGWLMGFGESCEPGVRIVAVLSGVWGGALAGVGAVAPK